jgi:polyisoprenoid-binding protein YceI
VIRTLFAVATVALAVTPAVALGQGAVAPAPAAAPAADAPWRIDVSHSDITFRIRHLMSRVTGTFNEWTGSIVADPAAWENAKVEVTIQSASIDTRNARRDADLRSANFFQADSFPTITFRSTKVERTGNKARLHGELTMRGVTRPVVLEGELLGLQSSANGRARVGFEASTTINRLDYGITYNRAVEAGGMLLGDEVEITINVEAVKG